MIELMVEVVELFLKMVELMYVRSNCLLADKLWMVVETFYFV